MRKQIALFASTALLLVAGLAGVASATDVILLFQPESPGSDLWDLNMIVPDAGVRIAAVAFSIVGNGALDFSIAQPATVIDPFAPTGFSVKDTTTVPGQIHIVLNVGTPGPIATGPTALVLGVLHVPAATNSFPPCGSPGQPTCDEFLPGTDDGGTIQDDQFNSLPFVVRFNQTPEPGTLLLLGLGGAALALTRLRGSPRGRTAGSSRPRRAASSAR